MTSKATPQSLTLLELGFRTAALRQSGSDQESNITLQEARDFGLQRGTNDNWKMNWHREWDHIEGLLHRIRVLVNEMHEFVENLDTSHLEQALAVWPRIRSEDDKLMKSISIVRLLAAELKASDRQDWNLLARKLDPHLESIHAQFHAMRIKLELLKTHSRAAVNRLVASMLEKRPGSDGQDGMSADDYQQELEVAALAIQSEQHEVLGVMDIVKSMFMWVESPTERVLLSRTLTIEESVAETPAK